ncbi:RNA ligase family protein [Peptacetobacter sp. AB800]|uniref:RNA ligase family protein n=1 Tax=Peptacetobacter sp. AB800 TaxID=3388428 RepID=UPI0039FDB8EA
MIEYPKVRRYSSIRKLNNMFKETDLIEVSEKIDGANASFCKDLTKKIGVACYSRENEVTEQDHLNGFYKFIKEEVAPNIRCLNPDYIYFGEWLTKHRLRYKKECYNKFYLFDIYDEKNKRWLTTKEKKDTIKYSLMRIFIKNLEVVPMTIIPYSDFNRNYELNKEIYENILPQINDNPEGFVFKAYDKTYQDEPLFFKVVNPIFEEVKATPRAKSNEVILMESICTESRIYKIILKLLDANTISDEDLFVENMSLLMKIIIPKVLEDILEEESDLIEEWKSKGLITDNKVGKSVGKITPKFIVKFIEGLD